MKRFFYLIAPSAFGDFGIVWQDTDTGPRLQRVLLSNIRPRLDDEIQKLFPGIGLSTTAVVEAISHQIQQFLKSEPIEFDLRDIALENCSQFQTNVLMAEHRIPRGWVSTYGRIAHKLGSPGGARAVGRALATNPFPIIIPCHRAVRSNGELGGYQGGVDMKRTLLEYEGIEFSKTDLVVMNSVFY